MRVDTFTAPNGLHIFYSIVEQENQDGTSLALMLYDTPATLPGFHLLSYIPWKNDLLPLAKRQTCNQEPVCRLS